MPIDIEPNGRFAAMLHARVEATGLSLREVAEKTGSTYEHMRKLIRGDAYPSKGMLTSLCKALDLAEGDAQKAVTADRIKHKFGKLPAILAGKNPELEPIEQAWPYLTDVQKQSLAEIAKSFAKNNSQQMGVSAVRSEV